MIPGSAARKGTMINRLAQRSLRLLTPNTFPCKANASSPITRPTLLCSFRLLLVTQRQSSAKQALCSTRNFATKPPSSTNGNAKVDANKQSSWWERWTAPREMPPRHTPRWYGEMVLICTVFGITGSGTMFLVRPAMSKVLGLEGSFKDGPWSYRICSLVIMTPLYATLLVIVGTIFGRHAYFRHFSVKMFTRFGVPPELMDPTFHQTKATFKKW